MRKAIFGILILAIAYHLVTAHYGSEKDYLDDVRGENTGDSGRQGGHFGRHSDGDLLKYGHLLCDFDTGARAVAPEWWSETGLSGGQEKILQDAARIYLC